MDAEFETFDVLSDALVRDEIKKFSNWPTIPQCYIAGEFVGGSDILLELFESGASVGRSAAIGVRVGSLSFWGGVVGVDLSAGGTARDLFCCLDSTTRRAPRNITQASSRPCWRTPRRRKAAQLSCQFSFCCVSARPGSG